LDCIISAEFLAMSEALFQKYLLMPFGYSIPWDEAKAGRLLWGHELLSNLLSLEIKNWSTGIVAYSINQCYPRKQRWKSLRKKCH